MRIFDDKAKVLNEMDTTLKNCMDTCIKDEYCSSFSFDKSGEDRTHNCATYQWYQTGTYNMQRIHKEGANQQFYDDEAYTSGILCSFEARGELQVYKQPEDYHAMRDGEVGQRRQTRPNRQPDDKYTLPGK